MTDPEDIDVVDERLPDLPITYKRTRREEPAGLMVFMPSAFVGALPEHAHAPQIPSRFKWRHLVPRQEVLAFADPAMLQHPRLRGAWYMHPRHDVIEAFAQIVTEILDELRLDPSRLTIYGSSLGGFGAIGLASSLPGSRALCEVPQLDFAGWFPTAVKEVETYITRMPIEDYRVLHPEQVSVLSRMERSGHIPAITIITNPGDRLFEQQKGLLDWVRQSDLPSQGEVNLVVTTLTDGHAVLSMKQATSLVNLNALVDQV